MAGVTDPASLLTHRVRGCNGIYHLKQFSLSYAHFNPDIQLCISPQNSNLVPQSDAADLLAEANDFIGIKFIRCGKNTLNTPYKEGLTGGATSGLANVYMSSANSGVIVYYISASCLICINVKQQGVWRGWSYLNPDPVVLWTGKEYTPGKVLTLEDNITRYKYIDIYINMSGNLLVQTFEVATNYYDAKGFNISNNTTNIGLSVAEMRIDRTTETTLTLNANSWVLWEWSGNANATATKANVTSSVYVYKIVGRY